MSLIANFGTWVGGARARISPSSILVDARRLVGGAEDWIGEVLSNPDLLRTTAAVLRHRMPIVRLGHSAVVTRFADVVEVLEHDEAFRVGPVYEAAMLRTSGDFILGMDDHARYDKEAGWLRSAVEADDVSRIRGIVAAQAERLLDAAAPAGRIDLASGYAHELALGVVAEYFGVSGPDPATMGRWMREIFWDIFLNLTNRSDVTRAALRSASELNAYLDGEIRRMRSDFDTTGKTPDTFFGRLVRQQRAFGMDDVALRRNIGGIIVGAVDTVSKATVHAIDQLLRRPTQLALARTAAEAGDDATVAAYTFEALRFNPHNPILIRACAADFALARGTDRETRIPAGTRVVASTLSAMFDGSVLPAPDEFRIDRPWEHYIHFGRGMHRCFGERFNRASVPQAVASLLRRPKLRRMNGLAGHIHYEGPFPKRLMARL